LAQPEFAQQLLAAGAGEPYLTTPEEFSARMRGDYEKYGKVIRAIGIKLE
jgi:tripartite-type tricarboxylate transporter receptor subunit TctC